MRIEIVTRLEQGTLGEDHLAVVRRDDACVIVVADGAGGTGSGGAAAAFVCGRAEAAAHSETRTSARWVEHLVASDQALRASGIGGESTVVVVEIGADGTIRGASVGDSGALAITVDSSVELTGEQHRKPLVGSGRAVPVGFGPVILPGRILIASDGLLAYTAAKDLVARAHAGTLEAVATALVDGVRLRSGRLPDDLALVLCERNVRPASAGA
jgi:hypothetical protein